MSESLITFNSSRESLARASKFKSRLTAAHQLTEQQKCKNMCTSCKKKCTKHELRRAHKHSVLILHKAAKFKRDNLTATNLENT